MHKYILIFLTLLPPLLATEPATPDLAYDCRAQFNALIRYISDRKAGSRMNNSFNKHACIEKGEDPTAIILRRTEAMLNDVKQLGPKQDVAALEAELTELKKQAAASQPEWKAGTMENPGYGGTKSKAKKAKPYPVRLVANMDVRYPIFEKAYLLQRKIAFANPLLDFDKLVFLKRHPAAYSHMVDQIFGITQAPGGGLYVMENMLSDSPTIRNVLGNSVCENGRFKGKKLEPGSFLSPDLSYDGTKIIFSYVEIKKTWPTNWNYKEHDWKPETCFHIFEVNVDGSNLRQLTDGPYNDTDPCYLPNGRICFISDRRGGQGRCHPGRMCPTYTLHSMLPDGSDIVPLSYHETNEWHPSVNNHGEIVYSRWDYVDRSVTAGQMPWVTKPDGRDARAIHGNYGEAKPTQGEWDPVPIPGNDSLYVGTLSMHHNQSYGTFSIFDASIWDHENEKDCVKYLTPEEGGGHGGGAYATAWPLHERYYLCVYSPNTPGYWNGGNGNYYEIPVKHGVYLLDCFGNKILLYRDKEISCHSPIPLRARPVPPRMPHMTNYAYPPDMQDKARQESPNSSTVAVMDVYKSLFPWPEDRTIKALRIVQVYPKTTLGQGRPRIGYAPMMNGRTSLGTVPVEADGSAHFTMPPKIPVYFQALDADGLAIQSMKTAIYTHPGETLTCVGCHEPKTGITQKTGAVPLAMKRQPSKLKPDANQNEPFTFPRMVQPVLDAKCIGCHQKHKKAPGLSGKTKRGWSEAYKNLQPYIWFVAGRGKTPHAHKAGQRSIPGDVGAKVSKLYKMLTTGSHKDKVKLTDEEWDRIMLWMDLNSPFLAACEDPNAQACGELVKPSLE